MPSSSSSLLRDNAASSRRSRRLQQQDTLSGFDWLGSSSMEESAIHSRSATNTDTDTASEGPVIVQENGYPSRYTCETNDAAAALSTKTLQFQFDYEFVIKDPRESLVEVFYQDLPVLEYGMLWMMVQAIGLDTCKSSSSNALDQFATPDSTLETTRVVSLASTRKDIMDPTVDACQVLVEIASDMICLPMRGKMTARYTGDDTAAVERYLLHHLQLEIDSQRVLVRQIKEILFLGDRSTYFGVDATTDTTDVDSGETLTRSGQGDSNAGLATGLSVSMFFLVFAVSGLLFRSRRHQRHSKEKTMATTKDSTPDIEPTRTGSTLGSNGYDQEVASNERDDAVAIIDEELAMDLIAADDDNVADDVSDCPSDVTALHPQDVAVAAKMVDVLPPRAPSTKPRSQTMKKRRRKKKKSKRKLTRTNSRENIHQMEAITEAADETSDSEGDGSEYYSTDEDSLQSRDPSPARSRTGSMGSSGSLTGVAPSPIKEEEPVKRKIRPLPPPWV